MHHHMKRKTEKDPLVTANRLAEFWGCDRRTVKAAIAAVPPHRVKGRVKFYRWSAVDPILTEKLC